MYFVLCQGDLPVAPTLPHVPRQSITTTIYERLSLLPTSLKLGAVGADADAALGSARALAALTARVAGSVAAGAAPPVKVRRWVHATCSMHMHVCM